MVRKEQRNRINAVVIVVLIILSLVLMTGCGKKEDVITYEIELDFEYYAPERGDHFVTLTKENRTHEDTLEMFAYSQCSASLSVYRYRHHDGDKIPEGVVYKAPISQMWKDFGRDCTSYELYQNDQFVKEVGFCFDDIFLTRSFLAEGGFMTLRELGTHKLTFNIPAMVQYGTEAITFEIILNVVEDPRPKTVEIYFQSSYAASIAREPDGVVSGMDFYILDQLPVFTWRDAVTQNNPDPLGGRLYEVYRKLDESFLSNRIESGRIEKGFLYLCRVDFLNSSVYQAASYQCIIWYR